MSWHSRFLSCLAVWLVPSLVPDEAAAQSLWIDPYRRGGFEFSVARPAPSEGLAFLSGAARLAASLPLGFSSVIHLELPVARMALDGPGGGYSETRIGAPYVGIGSADTAARVQFQFGVRFAPWDSDEAGASLLGVATDPERFESFAANIVAPRGAVQFGGRGRSGLVTQVRIGGTAMFGTGEAAGDPELLVDYGARLGSETARGFVYADLSGRLVATESGSLGERTIHYVGVSGGVSLGGITPTAEVRVPLDESSFGVDYIARIGARVRW